MSADAYYVYGVVPAGADLPEDVVGVTDGRLVLLESGALALLASPVRANLDLETRENVLAHARVLDAVALAAPVLPMRYGTVVEDTGDATSEILDANSDQFTALLDELEGTVQFTLTATYIEETILGEVAARNATVRELAQAAKERSVEESRDERIRLGELVVGELTGMREGDAGDLVKGLQPAVRELVIHEPGVPTVVLDAALLVELSARDRMEQVVEDAAKRHAERIRLRLVGPRAPYDFVHGE